MSEKIDNLKVIILAAGRGSRLNSEEAHMPKHMRSVAGKPILDYILKAVDFVDKKDILIIVGFMKEIIIEAFPDYPFFIQPIGEEFDYGTGAAVRYTKETIGEYSGDILVLMGDSPLMTKETLLNLYHEHKEKNNDCTNLSYEVNKNLALGRIIRDKNNNFCGIVENRDATDEQKKITEYNSGNAIFNSKKLFEQLANLKNNNKSGEYYLTDIPKLFMDNNYKVGIYKSNNGNELYGADSAENLVYIESILKNKFAK